jgi:prophage maintenance system killer protein
MSRLEVADLVVIAARALELEPVDALELIDLEAAEAALADARRWCDRDPVEAGAAAVLVGLVRHRPLARGNQQVALLATLQFLALHGWDLDLDPPTAARKLVDGLAAGTVGPQEVQAWMAARLRPYAKEDGMLQRLTRRRRTCMDVPTAEGPFERFTERARQSVNLAQEEARGLGHNYLGTEHLLLGLLVEGQGLAWRVLDELGISAVTVRGQVEAIIGRGPDTPAGPIPSHLAPRRSLSWPRGRPSAWATTTSAPNTCCWAWSGRGRGWPPRSWPGSAPTGPASSSRSWGPSATRRRRPVRLARR